MLKMEVEKNEALENRCIEIESDIVEYNIREKDYLEEI